MTVTQTSTDVTLPSDSRPPTLSQQIVRMEDQFAMAAPRGIEAKQLVRDALTALRQNPELAECDPQSVLGGLMTMAQLGLRVGVLGHGWLLPFRDWKTQQKKAQLVIGYQGLVELAYRSNKIKSLAARTVHANDHHVPGPEYSGRSTSGEK
jgi:recombination protein RecT